MSGYGVSVGCFHCHRIFTRINTYYRHYCAGSKPGKGPGARVRRKHSR